MIDPNMKITDLADFAPVTNQMPKITDAVALVVRDSVVKAVSTVMQRDEITSEQAEALSQVQQLVIGLWQNHHGDDNKPGSMTLHL